LIAEARAIAAERGIRRVEVKQLGTAWPPAPGFERSTRYTTYRVPTAEWRAGRLEAAPRHQQLSSAFARVRRQA